MSLFTAKTVQKYKEAAGDALNSSKDEDNKLTNLL